MMIIKCFSQFTKHRSIIMNNSKTCDKQALKIIQFIIIIQFRNIVYLYTKIVYLVKMCNEILKLVILFDQHTNGNATFAYGEKYKNVQDNMEIKCGAPPSPHTHILTILSFSAR